jgi:hypothetical protein
MDSAANNRPGTVMRDNEKGTCCHLRRQKCDKKEAERILKYGGTTTETQRVWNVTTEVILAITGAAGTVSKFFRK